MMHFFRFVKPLKVKHLIGNHNEAFELFCWWHSDGMLSELRHYLQF